MKIGNQSIKFNNTYIFDTSSVVGPKESLGPLSTYFDMCITDVFYGEKTFEKAEIKFLNATIDKLLEKNGLFESNIDFVMSGDLLNQCISSAYAMRKYNIPYFGLYNACSTFVEGIILSSVLIDNNSAKKIIATSSSHFCSAERQFRLPLEHGNQKAPTSQYTVTGAGAVLLSNIGNIQITYSTTGKVIDMGIKDINNMGAAMAPAAYDTIKAHLKDTKRDINYYDHIYTGDLRRYRKYNFS